MSATLTTHALPRLRADLGSRPLARPRGMTLEQRLESAWREVRAGSEAQCPLCRAPMRRGAGGSAECGGCGSQLS